MGRQIELPDRLALLPAAVGSRHVTQVVLAGRERPPVVALQRAAVGLPAGEDRWRVGPVRELVDEAMARFDGSRTAADAWLAPRLHATLRMTRSEAADRGLWSFLALAVAPDYVHWRHRSKAAEPTVTAARFNGPHRDQAFARLWWAAELFRDGDGYRPVEIACGNQDLLNTVLSLDVIDHRPTAQAIVRVLARLVAEAVPRPGDQMNALSSAINTAGSTLVYDVLAPDDLPDVEAQLDWIGEAQGAPPVPWESLPDGPDDGTVRRTSVDALVVLFEQLLADSPVRQRRKAVPGEE